MSPALALVFALALPGGAMGSQEICWSGTADSIGPRGADRVIQKSFAGLRVCALARDLAYAQHLPPSEWQAIAASVVLETQLEGRVHRMRLAPGIVTFERNGSTIAIDSSAAEWRAALMDVLTATWQLDRLHFSDTVTRVEASPSVNPPTSVQGMTASVPSELGAIAAELRRLKAEWKRSQNDINSLRDDASRLSRDIQVEQSTISQLQSQLASADARDRARINRDIQTANREIRRLNSTLQRVDLDVRSREAQLAGRDIPNRVEKLERQVREIAGTQIADTNTATTSDVAGRAAAVDRLIAAELERSTRELVTLRETALQRLRAVLNR